MTREAARGVDREDQVVMRGREQQSASGKPVAERLQVVEWISPTGPRSARHDDRLRRSPPRSFVEGRRWNDGLRFR
jgi:hypothetical protein